MQSITININSKELLKKVTQILESLENDGLEIVSIEDLEDLKLLKSTRNEESVPFDEFLKNES